MWFRNVDQRQLGQPRGLHRYDSQGRSASPAHNRTHADHEHMVHSGEQPMPFKGSGLTKSKSAAIDTAPLWSGSRPQSASAILRGQGLMVQASDVVQDAFLQGVENFAVRSAVADLRRGYLQTRDVVNPIDCLSNSDLSDLRVKHNRRQRASAEKARAAAVAAGASIAGKTIEGKSSRKQERSGAAAQTRSLCKMLKEQHVETMKSHDPHGVHHRRRERGPAGEVAHDLKNAINKKFFHSRTMSSASMTHGHSFREMEKEVVQLVQFLMNRYGSLHAAWAHVRSSSKSVDIDQWKAKLEGLGYESDPEMIFLALDKDGDCVMTWDELEEGLHAFMPGLILKGEEESLAAGASLQRRSRTKEMLRTSLALV